jgi:hypothetical protein
MTCGSTNFGDTCSIEFEWAFGVAHNVILDRLLDPVFGPGAHIALHDGQSLADCFADTARMVKVQCARQPATWIALRRVAWAEDETDGEVGRNFGERRKILRKAVEESTTTERRQSRARTATDMPFPPRQASAAWA